jgi:oxalate decarboxylase
MEALTRRSVLAATALGGAITVSGSARAAVFGNPDEPPQGAVNTQGTPQA